MAVPMVDQPGKLATPELMTFHESAEKFLRDVPEKHNLDHNDLRKQILLKFYSIEKHFECGGLSIKFHDANLNELYEIMKEFNKEKVDYQVIRVFLYREHNKECLRQGIYKNVYGF